MIGYRLWNRRLDPRLIDGLLAAAMLIEIELEAWLDTTVPNSHRALTAVAAIFYVAPVLMRRRWPALALLACTAAALIQAPLAGYLLVGTTGTLLPPLTLAYTVGRQLDLRRGLSALAVAVGMFAAGVAVSNSVTGTDSWSGLAQDLIGACALPAALWLLGRLAAIHAARTSAFAALGEKVAHQRTERENRAVAEQRVRIGRELQDIIAQNVSAIVLQAGAVRELIHTDPQRARDSIFAVEQAGREALTDLRRTLGLLRPDDAPRSLAPVPRLSHIDALLRAGLVHGLTCELRRVGNPTDDLAPGIDLLAYRIVEAVLAAAVDHGTSTAEVTISNRLGRLEIDIHGDTPIPAEDDRVVATADRVALYRGTLKVLASSEDGFTIRARLPIKELAA